MKAPTTVLNVRYVSGTCDSMIRVQRVSSFSVHALRELCFFFFGIIQL